MSLDAAARRRYARQLLLGEIGETGQERLLESGFRPRVDGDGDAYVVAADYLERAGCPREENGVEVRVPRASSVMRFAGSQELQEPAAAVIGAFAAVEHLKEVLGVAPAQEFPPELKLSAED